jgi:hypothetical protein
MTSRTASEEQETMPTIHGRSHIAIKHFHANPAAMAVYWIYLARCNYENVAWPSLRLLVVDTKWSINVCREARQWLVEHKALELLKDYVRPDWRALDAKTRKRRLSLDHTEYYRPTGTLEVGGKVYQMLYEAAKDNHDVSRGDTSHDVSRGTTSHVDGHRPRDTELDSSTALDSKKTLRTTTTTGDEVVVAATETEIALVFRTYEANIGLLTPAIKDGIMLALSEVPAAWVVEAIVLATQKEKRFWKFADGILKNWKLRGKDAPPPAANGSNGNGKNGKSAAADAGREQLDQLTDDIAAGLPQAPPEDYLSEDDDETRAFAWSSTGRRAVAREQAQARLAKEGQHG